jgi:Fibronectin type III domain
LARYVRILVALTAGLALAGLAPGGSPALALTGHGHTATRLVNPRTGLPIGVMPTIQTSAARPRQAASIAHLAYFGGPVVSNARLETVLWGRPADGKTYLPQVTDSTTPNFSTFFGQVGASPYLSWLREYDTGAGTGQQVGYVSFLGRTAITPTVASGSLVQDSAIQQELVQQINARHLPAPVLDAHSFADTVYALFFPAGTQVCMGTSCSGQTFCAYHSSFPVSVGATSLSIRYMVLPYADANILNGCSSTGVTTAFPITESFTSHELIETITDPDVGQATVFGPPLAWYDEANGEIADICQFSSDPATGSVLGSDGQAYVVQNEWSNALDACATTRPGTAGAPTALAATPRAGGAVQLSWQAPGDDGGNAVTSYDVYRSTSASQLGSVVGSVPATTTGWTSPALPDGQTQFFRVVAVNAVWSGLPSVQASAVPDSAPPTTAMTAPTGHFQLASTITARWSGSDTGSGVASFDVQLRSARWNGAFGPWAPFATGTTATSAALSGTRGTEYCFRVRATDVLGNASAWSTPRCTSVPLDDRSLAASAGWSRLSNTSAYGGTISRTTTGGATLSITGVRGDRLAVVVTTCPTCGKLGVLLGGTLWKSISLVSATTHTKVIRLPGTFSLRTTSVGLKNLTAGKPVYVDGLGVSRT